MSSKRETTVGAVDKRERSMIREALGRERRPAAYLAPEPIPERDRRLFTEAYAIEQAEKAARRRRLLREAIARRIPAQQSGDSTTGLQMPKKAV